MGTGAVTGMGGTVWGTGGPSTTSERLEGTPT